LVKQINKRENLLEDFEEREISLENSKCFSLFIGKRVLKKEIINLNGNVPIYSANVNNPVGYHTKSYIFEFTNNFVLWGINGNFEFNFIPKNQPFYPTDHCGVIRILENDILPEYLMIQLENIKYKFSFDRNLRASLENMKQISVPIPYYNQKIDIDKQKEVVEKYKQIEKIKENIKEELKKIENVKTNIGIRDRK
jgi:type I restriction enzyme M protein